MEFRATREGFVGEEERQMLSRGKHHHPFSTTSSTLEEMSFFQAPAMEDSSKNTAVLPVEKEHMFDKVVTPSDVGKLNRLVIPKQHAERYFPLDSSGNEKGLLLNFEDRNGKPWRLRYSYWNSSQSYVITKGWSRFVKEKRLDAGDIVSFQRGVGESNKHRLFIDWRRRRPDHNVQINSRQEHQFVPTMNMNHHGLLSFPHHQYLFRGSVSSSWVNPNFARVSSGSVISSYHGGGNGGYGYGGRSLMNNPMVIESTPVVQGKKMKTESKRLRLFGVNMECPNPDSDHECTAKIQTPFLHHVVEKGKSTLSFDFGC